MTDHRTKVITPELMEAMASGDFEKMKAAFEAAPDGPPCYISDEEIEAASAQADREDAEEAAGLADGSLLPCGCGCGDIDHAESIKDACRDCWGHWKNNLPVPCFACNNTGKLSEAIKDLAQNWVNYLDALRSWEEGDYDWTDEDYDDAKDKMRDQEYGLAQICKKELTSHDLVAMFGCDVEEAVTIDTSTWTIDEIGSAAQDALDLVNKWEKIEIPKAA